MLHRSIDDAAARTEVVAAWCRAYGEGRGTHDGVAMLPTALPTAGRPAADAQAAWRRWHDTCLDSEFSTTEWPWYEVLERARVETLASSDLPGIARNLACLDALLPDAPALAALYRAARCVLADETAPEAERVDDEVVSTLEVARLDLTDGQHFAATLRPLIARLAASDEASDEAQLSPESLPGCEEVSEKVIEKVSEGEHEEAYEEDDSAELTQQRTGDAHEEAAFETAYPGYAIASRAWDEEREAEAWWRPGDTALLQALDGLDRQRVRRLAHRLQRRLLAARQRHWRFDQEQGRLDSRRLARLIGERPEHRVFREESEAPMPEACVTLLVDQSGSMRGARREIAALAVDLAVHTLELCQIKCEVLGFTTRFAGDNPVQRHWQGTGAVSVPGRLNAVRHIIYKSSEQPWRRARPRLGLLLREGFGQENIDGEALHWAARRLIRQPQTRKILVVLSDGAPYDAATVNANGRGFLEQHLREVIKQIEASPLHLAALGAGQEVGRFYRHAVTVRRPEALAETLFMTLGDLLTHERTTKETP